MLTLLKLSKTETSCDSERRPCVIESYDADTQRDAAILAAVLEYEHYHNHGTNRDWHWGLEIDSKRVGDEGNDLTAGDWLGMAENGIEESDIYDALIARGMSDADAESALA